MGRSSRKLDTAWYGGPRPDEVVHFRRRTVICSEDVSRETDVTDMEQLKTMVEEEVAKFIQETVKGLNVERSKRWEDPDFGPTKTDMKGKNALYRNGRSAIPGYPKPEEVKWARPGYHGSPVEADTFCKNGKLFKRGKALISSTLIQGKLGNGWFLSAVSIAASRPDVLKQCFWRLDDYKDYGIFVVRFFKNNAWYYVIIDDQLPIFNCKNGHPCFARCKDIDELWLPLLEKAYAKLHFSYDSLSGGQVEVALREITGLCTDRIMLSRDGKSLYGGSQAASDGLWRKVRECLDYGSAVGCMSQPEDGLTIPDAPTSTSSYDSINNRYLPERTTGVGSNSARGTVVPSAIRGLEKRHAYSVVGAAIVANTKIVLLHNPWGFGKWLGPWSDVSAEYLTHETELSLLFKNGELHNDAYFLMSWGDFLNSFTSMYNTISLENTVTEMGSQWRGGFLASSKWSESSAGGGLDKETWFTNPRFRFRVKEPQTRVYIQVFVHDRRMESSKYTNGTLYSFTICEIDPTDKRTPIRPSLKDPIPGSNPRVDQPEYSFMSSCSHEFYLTSGDYVLVPSTFDRGILDSFSVFIFHDKPIFVEGGLPLLHQDNNKQATAAIEEFWNPLANTYSNAGDESIPIIEISPETDSGLSMETPAQRKERAVKAELIKERLLKIAKDRKIQPRRIIDSFPGSSTISRMEFKQRMIALGFMVSEIPDAEFRILAFPKDEISSEKIRAIFEQDARRQALMESKPRPIQDDLMFRPVSSTEGVLVVKTLEAKDLVLPNLNHNNMDDDVASYFHADVRRLSYRCVYRSNVLTISKRPVIVRVWQLLENPNSPCVPIAYDIEQGKDFGFTEAPSFPLYESDVRSEINEFWRQKEDEWENKLSLDYDPLPQRQQQTDVYVANRESYIKTVLESKRGDPTRQEFPVNKSRSIDFDDLANHEQEHRQTVLPPKSCLRSVYSLIDSVRGGPETSAKVRNEDGSNTTLREMDMLRNEQFMQLGYLSKENRREMGRKLATGKEQPSGFTEEKRKELLELETKQEQEFFSSLQKSRAGMPISGATGGDESINDEESKSGSGGEIEIPTPVDEAFKSEIASMVSGFLDDVYEVLFTGREDIEPLPTEDEDYDLVYSRVTAIPGEGKVLREQLSRTANLDEWFAQFDLDSSGRIDQMEFTQALSALGFDLAPEQTSRLLTHLDKDGDGMIDPKEFAAFVQADDDKSLDENLQMEELLEAIASPSVDKKRFNERWSIGKDWYKLRHLAMQLRDLTQTCKSLAHRTMFSCAPTLAAVRAYRVAHLFETPEAFVNFLSRTHTGSSTTTGEKGLVDSSDPARDMLFGVLKGLQGPTESNQVDLDAVMANIPNFVEQMVGVGGNDAFKSTYFSAAVLKAYAKGIVADRLAEEFKTGTVSNTNNGTAAKSEGEDGTSSREDELLEEVLNTLNTDVVKTLSYDPATAQADIIRLTLSEHLRLLLDDAFFYCKVKIVNKAALARMLNPDSVKSVEMKLRHILRQHSEARAGPVNFLVDIFCKRSTPSEEAVLKIRARNPALGRVLEIENVPMSQEDEASLPPKGSVVFGLGRRMTNSRPTTYGPSEIWKEPRFFEGVKHFLDDVSERLVICKSASSGGDRLQLVVKECPQKVQFVRETLESCSDLPFFFQVSDTSVKFLVDKVGADCKAIVLDALRTKQGNRVARALSHLESTLNVVFGQTHGDFREEMSWTDFAAYLAEKRNSVVQVNVKPEGQNFTTPVAKDGGFNPIFRSSFKVPYTPIRMVNRTLLLTRVCRINKQYLILFIHHISHDQSRLGIVAYDPRSNDEYSLVFKTRKDPEELLAKKNELRRKLKKPVIQPTPEAKLQMWGSPKHKKRPGSGNFFSSQPVNQDENVDDGNKTPMELYEPETIKVMETYPVFQDSRKEGVMVGTKFPLHDENAWERVLEHVDLGECLTPHVEFIATTCVEGQTISNNGNNKIGSAKFPLSAVTNNPGQAVDRWVSLVDKEGNDMGKLHVSFRFDDSKNQVDDQDSNGPEVDELVGFDTVDQTGDESFAPAVDDDELDIRVERAARTAKDYSLLAQRLREEVLETKTKLAESEKQRMKLEQTCVKNEERLRQTRGEIEHHRRKLEEAEALAKSNEPRPPKRGASAEDHEAHAKLVREHDAKLRELDSLKKENEKLRYVTDAREGRLNEDLRSLRERLAETEMKLRLEVSEKQELLKNVEKANVDAQVNLAKTSSWSKRPVSRRSKEEREQDRKRREQWLRDRLGKEYETYVKELDLCVGQIENQLATRRPDKPEQPVRSLENLLQAQAKPNQSENKVASENFQETLLDFGIQLKPADMELLVTHFDTGGDNNICIDEFMDYLRSQQFKASRDKRIAAAGFRGVQTVQNQRNNRYHQY